MVDLPLIEGPFFDAVDANAEFDVVEAELIKLTAPLGVVAVGAFELIPAISTAPSLNRVFGKPETDYIRRYKAENMAASDVAITRIAMSRGPFSWNDAKKDIVAPEQEAVFAKAAEHGYKDGWLVPQRMHGGIGATTFMGERLSNAPGARRLLTFAGNVFYDYAKIRTSHPDGLEQVEAVMSELPKMRGQVFYLMVVKGMSNKEIARIIDRSVRTVDNHVSALLKRFKVHSRNELSAKIAGHNMLTENPMHK